MEEVLSSNMINDQQASLIVKNLEEEKLSIDRNIDAKKLEKETIQKSIDILSSKIKVIDEDETTEEVADSGWILDKRSRNFAGVLKGNSSHSIKFNLDCPMREYNNICV